MRLFFAVFPFLLFFCVPAFSHAEYIQSFDSDISIAADSSFEVREVITYVFTEPRHGIFRSLPLLHPDPARLRYEERIIDVVVDTVLVDGNSVPYEVEYDSDMLTIRIGDPNITIDGTHEYILVYTVHGGISYPRYGGAELYWNVTGNEWQIPIQNVTVRVSSPDQILRSERACYRGLEGVVGSCNPIEVVGETIVFTTTDLGPHYGMTIAQAVDRSKIAHVELTRIQWLWIILPLGLIGLIYGAFRLYTYETAFRTGRTIIPQYEPYPEVKPMYTGLLFDDRLDPRDITACIVYLAEQGFLTIKKLEKKVLFIFEVDDYEITLKKPLNEEVGSFERMVLELLFDRDFVPTASVSLSELKNSLSTQQKNSLAIQSLRRELSADLVRAGFFERFPWKKLGALASIGVLVPALVLMSDVQNTAIFMVCVCMLILSGIGMPILMRRRTRKGYEALDHLEGFKMFLEMTERDRYAFHNAPKKSPEQFMKYLPYAIAFGVEKEWSNVFKDVTIPSPGWYEGDSVRTFSAPNFASSIGAFSTAFASSSGSSASSGGGHAGGGAGGGGGGSW